MYKELHLKDKLPTMSEAELFKLLASDGMLVKRPLLVGDGFVLETYDRTQRGKKGEFSAFVEEKRKELTKPEGNRVTTRDLAARMGIEYEQFRKILNKQKPTKKRILKKRSN